MKRLCLLVGLAMLPLGPACAAPPSDSVPEPSQESVLRQRLDAAIDLSRRRYLRVNVHNPWQIAHGIIAFGTEFRINDDSGKKVSAVEFFTGQTDHQSRWRVFRKHQHGLEIAGGLQGHPNQFLAILAQSRIPLDYAIKVGGEGYTVQNLLARAQRDHHRGQEASWTLIAFSEYLPGDSTWTGRYGETFDLEDLVSQEVSVEPTSAACGGTHNLYALAFALQRWRARGGDVRGVWQQAAAKLDRYREATRRSQNEDGLLSSNYYSGRGWTGDFTRQIDSTGHTLEWLLVHLNDEQLQQPWVTRAVAALLAAFERTSDRPLDCGPLYHATHALVLYRDRRFAPETIGRASAPRDADPTQESRDLQRDSDDASVAPGS